jgi:hypothetical protein
LIKQDVKAIKQVALEHSKIFLFLIILPEWK